MSMGGHTDLDDRIDRLIERAWGNAQEAPDPTAQALAAWGRRLNEALAGLATQASMTFVYDPDGRPQAAWHYRGVTYRLQDDGAQWVLTAEQWTRRLSPTGNARTDRDALLLAMNQLAIQIGARA